jgi:hypothetical protein
LQKLVKSASAIFVVAPLVSGCVSDAQVVEPRALTKGNYQPICLAICTISTSLTSSEGIVAPNAQGSVSGTQTGGASTANVSTNAKPKQN